MNITLQRNNNLGHNFLQKQSIFLLLAFLLYYVLGFFFLATLPKIGEGSEGLHLKSWKSILVSFIGQPALSATCNCAYGTWQTSKHCSQFQGRRMLTL